MTQAKFISSEPKSGISAEEMGILGNKIEAALNRISELNGDALAIKAEMALKNRYISPQQEKELFDLVNESSALYDRFNLWGERTQDLLDCLERHGQALEQKRNELFPDAPKDAELKPVKKESREKAEKKKGASDKKRQPLKIKPKEAGQEAAPEEDEEAPEKEETEIIADESLIAQRAAEIRQRRMNNEKGFEWAKIDELLRQKGLEPNTSAAAEFLDKWDINTAKSELRREEIRKRREGVSGDKTEITPEFLKIKPAGKMAVEGMPRAASPDDVRVRGLVELEEQKREKELARLGTDITLSKITDYKELWAQTEQEGDEKFKEKTRELWKEFAVHGKVLKDKETSQLKLMQFTDFDGNSSLGLLNLAGINTENLEYKTPGEYTEGKINIDTGERNGIVVEDGGKTVFIDHHSDESGRDSSATRFTYELLVSLGLLEKQEYLDKLVEFVTQADNKTYPDAGKYFKNYNRNLLGLKDHIKFDKLVEFFKEGHQPHEVLLEKELKKMGLLEVSKQKKAAIDKSLAELERKKDSGLIIETPRYGTIIVDIDKKIPYGFDAVRYAGYKTYLSWSPADNSFFISSVEPITDSFQQGKKIRGHMWIKPAIDGEPLSFTLKEVLTIMTDGQFQPAGELAEFLAKEGQGESKDKKAELAPGVREILVSAIDEFRQRLQKEAAAMEGWGKYKPEQQKTLLEIETESFLRNLIIERLVSKGVVAAENVDALAADLLKENKETSGPTIDASGKKWLTQEEYAELFRDRSSEELDILRKQLTEKQREIMDSTTHKIFQSGKYARSQEFEDLLRQKMAIQDLLSRRKLDQSVKKVAEAAGLEARPAEGAVEK